MNPSEEFVTRFVTAIIAALVYHEDLASLDEMGRKASEAAITALNVFSAEDGLFDGYQAAKPGTLTADDRELEKFVDHQKLLNTKTKERP